MHPCLYGDRQWRNLVVGDHVLRRTAMEEVEVPLPTVKLCMI
jgi:hypothetical protein